MGGGTDFGRRRGSCGKGGGASLVFHLPNFLVGDLCQTNSFPLPLLLDFTY